MSRLKLVMEIRCLLFLLHSRVGFVANDSYRLFLRIQYGTMETHKTTAYRIVFRSLTTTLIKILYTSGKNLNALLSRARLYFTFGVDFFFSKHFYSVFTMTKRCNTVLHIYRNRNKHIVLMNRTGIIIRV